ncbi:hypothetical protein [Bacillus toyonensis]|uniref:hypothetical protein n=1 Tax=Bacillus toyonensis TaxID=155322 RepID=UPI00124E91DD|nr:hypothetical protein [Bacillus toyonensis]KAB2355885.1 hypothetical protein F8503_25935 [Bacillus toyonensis]
MILATITGTDWAFIITFFFAAISGIIAQYASHNLSKKREEEKDLKESYQNLYSPLLYEVTKYIDVETTFRGDALKDTFNKEDVFNEIKRSIKLNLKYAPFELIRAYEEVRKSEIYEDFRGDTDTLAKAKLCFIFLEELNHLNLKLNKQYSYDLILKYRFYYSLWILIYEYSDNTLANNVLKYKWQFNEETFTEELIAEIVQLTKTSRSFSRENLQHEIKNILVNTVNEEDIEHFQPIKDLKDYQ